MSISGHEHGARAYRSSTVGTVATLTNTAVFYCGIAPVNLVRGYADKGLVNQPIKVTSLANAQSTFGYSTNFGQFTLCEAISAHFSLMSVGPIWLSNVLNPDTDRKSEKTTGTVSFSNGYAYVTSDTIILDTIEVSSTTGEGEDAVTTILKEGTDYAIDYEYSNGRAVLESLTDTPLDGTYNISYWEVDPTKRTKTDIIGGVTASGKKTGLQVVSKMFAEQNQEPNLIVCPGFSQYPEVASAMVAACADINGCFQAFAILDLPTVDESGVAINTITKALAWRAKNGYSTEDADVCWPMVTAGGYKYHISTLAACQFQTLDNENDGVPMESVSNKEIPIDGLWMGDSDAEPFDRQDASALDEAGILSAINWQGRWTLWGGHTSTYRYGGTVDPRAKFENGPRIMAYLQNWFAKTFNILVDERYTRQSIDTIRNMCVEKVNALKNMGALIGDPTVEVLSEDNTSDKTSEGILTIRLTGTSAPMLHGIIGKIAYSTEGLETLVGGDDE